MLIIDLETRSRCDLIACGSYEYAADPSTEVICIGWALGGESGVVESLLELPKEVIDYILLDTDKLIGAFNAQFERLVWEHCCTVWPIHPNRWYCISAQMRVNALPAGLNDAGRALSGKYVKDFRGAQLIKALSIPMKDGTFNEDPALIKEMLEYCEQDCIAAQYCMDNTRLMSKGEFEDYLVNERINDVGVGIDAELCALAEGAAEVEGTYIADHMIKLTGGAVTKPTQAARIRTWVTDRLTDDHKELLFKHDGKASLDKNVRARLLDRDDLHPDVRKVLELTNEGNLSSVSKFRRMRERSQTDGAARGSFIYAGASQTLRYASRGLQLHNMKRDCYTAEEAEAKIEHLHRGGDMTMKDLSMLLRPALVPEVGNTFVVGDWSSIEARCLPWLSKKSQSRLTLFKQGKDIYQVTADQLFDGNRQIGKVAELALGFGGAVGAFRAMAANYGLSMTHDDMQDAVDDWRGANQWAVDFWQTLGNAAEDAVRSPGDVFEAGRVTYRFIPELIGGTLICTLPDGSAIQYPQCGFSIDHRGNVNLAAMKAAWKPKAGETEWPKVRLWGGMLAENITQATAAALLRDALRRCEQQNLTVVGHVHDEIIIECSDEDCMSKEDDLQTVMEHVPSWAKGLPIAAEPKIMKRYGK